jgi:site-specific recombinase XerD
VKLLDLIEQYVGYRKALGERCVTNGSVLRAFGRKIGTSAEVGDVQVDHVSAFLAGQGPLTSTWHVKHCALVGFYGYAVSRGYASSAPLPAMVPKRPPPFVPYIYSHDELHRLLAATDTYQRNRSCLEPVTVRNIVLLLYGAGLRLREALALNRADVDLDESLLTVRRTKFFKTRFVPLGPQLRQAMLRYADRHRGVSDSASGEDSAPFFTTRKGNRVNADTIEGIFRRVCEHAKLRRSDGARYQPRLHDLRHAFAVHQLTAWYRRGLDVQKLLPLLSVYMGHVHLAATQIYLSMTPELLHEANSRFERYAMEERRHD